SNVPDFGLQPGLFNGVAHIGKRVRIARDFEDISVAPYVFGTRLQRQIHERLFIDLIGRNRDQSLSVEHPGNTAGSPQLAPGDLEYLAHFARRAVAVIGENVAEHRDPTRAIPLVQDFLEVDAFQITRAFFNRPVDRVLGHVARFGVDDRVAQAQILIWITAAGLCRDDDPFGELAPQLA